MSRQDLKSNTKGHQQQAKTCLMKQAPRPGTYPRHNRRHTPQISKMHINTAKKTNAMLRPTLKRKLLGTTTKRG